MFLSIIFFILGFVFLIKGADFLVDGSSSVAKKYGISNLVIGLTIVAFGTSAPELVVSALAAFKGSSGIAMGNIIGSNIFNTLLILGVAAIIHPLLIKKSTVSKEIPFSLLAVLAVGILVNDNIIDGMIPDRLTRIDGLTLILFFSVFIYYTFGISKTEETITEVITDEKIEKYGNLKSVGMIVLGLVGLYLGGQWIIDSATIMARYFGISEILIGLTIVAIGTSLPELAASAMAAFKGHSDMAIGNVVGSNIFNLFWVLGVSSIIRPIPFSPILNIDFVVLFGITILLLILIFVGKRNILEKWEGVSLLSLYIIYIIYIVMRG